MDNSAFKGRIVPLVPPVPPSGRNKLDWRDSLASIHAGVDGLEVFRTLEGEG
jgi:hypothetical protein